MRLYSLMVLLFLPGVFRSCTVTMPHTVLEMVGKRVPYNLSGSSRAIQLKGGYRDTLIIGDEIDSGHGQIMLRHITIGSGIPESHTRFFEEFGGYRIIYPNLGLEYLTSGDYEPLRQKTRVIHIPVSIPLASKHDIPLIMENNILFVLPAENMHDSYQGDRDLWNPEHAFWAALRTHPLFVELDVLQTIHDINQTGKVIWATHAIRISATEVTPDSGVVSCGDIKEHCFSTTGSLNGNWHTSGASARLAALSFYLSQLYDTPEEVITTLQECAIDVGEPGVDREYGRGLLNLLCPRVLKKELEVVAEYVTEEKEEESVLQETIEGAWVAEETRLEVYLPKVLQETLDLQYAGTVEGDVAFEEHVATIDFTTTADVSATFLLPAPIEAKARDVVQIEGRYTTEENRLTIHSSVGDSLPLTYQATEDSLKLIRSLTLNEALNLLPGILGNFAKKETEDWFQDDPIQIIATFAREILLLGDFDRNNIVDFTDFLLFTAVFGTNHTHPLFNERMDLVPDGMINFADFLVFVENFGKTTE